MNEFLCDAFLPFLIIRGEKPRERDTLNLGFCYNVGFWYIFLGFCFVKEEKGSKKNAQ